MKISRFNEYAGHPLYDEISEDVRHQIRQIELNLKDDGYKVYISYWQPHHSESGKEECEIQIPYSYVDGMDKDTYQARCIEVERRIHNMGADRVSARVTSTEKYGNRSVKYAGSDISRFNFDTVTFVMSWNPTDPISYSDHFESISQFHDRDVLDKKGLRSMTVTIRRLYRDRVG